jgi:hypothetical protein
MPPGFAFAPRATEASGLVRYHLRWTRPANALLTVFWAAIWLVLVLASNKTNWLVMGALGVGLVVIAAWANLLAVRSGVYEAEHGIIVTGLFRTTCISWKDLAGFDHERRGTHDIVYARRTDGSRQRLVNVLQGQRVVWRDGETRDILGVLMRRLGEVGDGADRSPNEPSDELKR